jgi:hypothetical protein
MLHPRERALKRLKAEQTGWQPKDKMGYLLLTAVGLASLASIKNDEKANSRWIWKLVDIGSIFICWF